jgi:putative SOS response-associated peptidase YedK
VAESRAFGEAFRQRRCLVPADGWYEWRIEDDADERVGRARRTGKRPYFMTRPEPVVFAGLWSRWGTGPQTRVTFSIITVAAAGELATVHNRMPLLIEPDQWIDWLRGDHPTDLLVPMSGSCAGIEIRPVSAAVGDVRNDGPELVRRMGWPDSSSSTVDFAPRLF